MKQKTLIIGGMAGVAIFLVYRNKEKMEGKDPSFREGYLAGFFTPGPFTILALAGLAHAYA